MSQITLRRINNEFVKAIPNCQPLDKRPVLGATLFPELFANILIFARKKSGKTTVIYKIIDKCIDSRCVVYAFVSTLYNDKGWQEIRKLCQKKGIEFHGYTSLVVNGSNLLNNLVAKFEMEAKEREIEQHQQKGKKNNIIYCDDTDSDDEDEPHYKTQAPEYLIILDDMSKLSRNKAVEQLMKQNRHYHCKVIVSSQGVLDAMPDARKNADYWLVFRGLGAVTEQNEGKKKKVDKVEDVWAATELPISLQDFREAYRIAMIPTKQNPKPFLYIDTNEQLLRKSFADIMDLKPPQK